MLCIIILGVIGSEVRCLSHDIPLLKSRMNCLVCLGDFWLVRMQTVTGVKQSCVLEFGELWEGNFVAV